MSNRATLITLYIHEPELPSDCKKKCMNYLLDSGRSGVLYETILQAEKCDKLTSNKYIVQDDH